MLTHTIRLRVLKTLGSGDDSTTTAGGLAAGFGGGAAAGGGAVAAGVSWLGTLSKPQTSVPESY